jgi:hypothetical protein
MEQLSICTFLINVCSDPFFMIEYNRKKLKTKKFESTLKVGDKIILKWTSR